MKEEVKKEPHLRQLALRYAAARRTADDAQRILAETTKACENAQAQADKHCRELIAQVSAKRPNLVVKVTDEHAVLVQRHASTGEVAVTLVDVL